MRKEYEALDGNPHICLKRFHDMVTQNACGWQLPSRHKKTHIEIYTYLEQTKKSYNLHARLEFRMNDLY